MTDDLLDYPEHRETIQTLERSLPRVAPPPDLLDRILERVEPGAEGAEIIPLTPRHSRGRAVGLSAAAAAVAVAASVAITLAVSGGDDLGTPALRASLAPIARTAKLTGDVELFQPDDPGGMLVVDLQNVPPPPADHFYEVWVLPAGSAVMIAVGTFTPTSSHVHLELPLPEPGAYAAVDISVEDRGGSQEHSGTSLAAAKLS